MVIFSGYGFIERKAACGMVIYRRKVAVFEGQKDSLDVEAMFLAA